MIHTEFVIVFTFREGRIDRRERKEREEDTGNLNCICNTVFTITSKANVTMPVSV